MKKTTIIIFLLSTLIIGCSDEHPSLDRGLFANLQTNKGDIILQLEMEKTPVTVANFVSLANLLLLANVSLIANVFLLAKRGCAAVPPGN